MRGKMETLAVFHILKNGGTTLVDRYRLNHSFVYQRVHNEVVYNYKQSNQMCSKVSNLKDYDVPVEQNTFGYSENMIIDFGQSVPADHNQTFRLTNLRWQMVNQVLPDPQTGGEAAEARDVGQHAPRLASDQKG